jgi:hypothetical protein
MRLTISLTTSPAIGLGAKTDKGISQWYTPRDSNPEPTD